MEIFIALAVVLILTIFGSALIMSEALARLTASVTAVGREVSETAEAIRNHVQRDSGISQSALLELADRLDASANSLNSLQSDLGGSEPPAAEAPAADQGLGGDQSGTEPPATPAPDVDPAVTGDAAGGAPAADQAGGAGGEFGNQNGIGSEFEQGAGGGPIDLNSQSPDGGQPDSALGVGAPADGDKSGFGSEPTDDSGRPI